MSEKKHRISNSQYEELKAKLDKLYVDMENNTKTLNEARAYGDLSENSDYDAARNEQGKLNESINILGSVLNNYTIVDENSINKNIVDILATVTFTNLSTKQNVTCTIVDSALSDILKARISDDSPIATAFLGHKVGDVVRVICKNPYLAKIVKIEYIF